MSVMRYDPWAE